MEITKGIPVQNVGELKARIDKMNRRAAKLGLIPISLTQGEHYFTKYQIDIAPGRTIEVKTELVSCTVIGEDPVLAGWRMLAAITPQPNGENLLRVVPGVDDLPEVWRSTKPERCDHCRIAIARKDVFILRHEDGHEAQVGRTCIGDFLGHVSPEAMLNRASYMLDLGAAMDELEDEFWGGSGGVARCVTTKDFFILTASVVRAVGFVSKKNADIYQKPSTCDNVMNVVFAKKHEDLEWERKVGILPISAEAIALGEAAYEWAKTVPGKNDYLYNIGVAARQETVPYKSMGLLASAVSTYEREMGYQRELKAANPNRTYVGTIGKRENFTVKCVFKLELDSDFGVKTMLKFEDEAGNALVWFATGKPGFYASETDYREYQLDGVYTLKATVKKHEEYKGVPQTILTRATLVKFESAEIAAAVAA